jgi:anti-sigma regulatory factor (Ser/Thr protein kinase)/anti-anti-sigma regulatory factor
MLQTDDRLYTVSIPIEVMPDRYRDFEGEIAAALTRKAVAVCIECGELERVTSSHVNLLWQAHQACLSAGAELRLAHPSAGLLRILRMMDLIHVFGMDEASSRLELKPDECPPVVTRTTTYADTFVPTVMEIDNAIGRFVGFITSVGAGPSLLLELRTIFYEIATNIRIHSGLSEQDAVSFEACANADRLTITFIDTGNPFNPTAGREKVDAVQASHQRQKRGFGLPMIHQFADSIAYHRDESGRNILTLSKKWHC